MSDLVFGFSEKIVANILLGMDLIHHFNEGLLPKSLKLFAGHSPQEEIVHVADYLASHDKDLLAVA